MIEPVEKDVWVPATVEAAFRRFTAEMTTWWPYATHSVGRANCAGVHLDGRKGGRLYEVGTDGTESEWGIVQEWDAPNRFVVTWHPGNPAELAQEVEVGFLEKDGGTTVKLTHRNFEALGDAERAQTARDNYDGGWKGVLEEFVGVEASV